MKDRFPPNVPINRTTSQLFGLIRSNCYTHRKTRAICIFMRQILFANMGGGDAIRDCTGKTWFHVKIEMLAFLFFHSIQTMNEWKTRKRDIKPHSAKGTCKNKTPIFLLLFFHKRYRSEERVVVNPESTSVIPFIELVFFFSYFFLLI